MIRQHLKSTMPHVEVMTARTLSEAHVLIYQYEFAGFVIDLALPDGTGLEFIVDLQTVMPDAQVVVLTATPREDIQQRLSELHLKAYLQKPFDLMELERYLRAILPTPQESPSFQGSLRQLRLVDLIQIKCLAFDSCKLVISGLGGVRGVIVIDEGAIVHAETDRLRGAPAFNEILSWKGGTFHEEEFRGGVEVNMTGRWETVLMEAVRQSDECHALQAA
jgi:CheY-like chemotaxis protein